MIYFLNSRKFENLRDVILIKDNHLLKILYLEDQKLFRFFIIISYKFSSRFSIISRNNSLLIPNLSDISDDNNELS